MSIKKTTVKAFSINTETLKKAVKITQKKKISLSSYVSEAVEEKNEKEKGETK